MANPHILIQKGDYVKLNKTGLSYLGDEYQDIIFEVHNTWIDEEQKKDCTIDNDNKCQPNCGCYHFFDLRPLWQTKIIESAMLDELILVDIPRK